MNKVLLLGRLGQDPTDKGEYGYFSLATSRKKKDGTDHVSWHTIFVYGKTKENCMLYLKKGKQCFVEGQIGYKQNEDKSWSASIQGYNVIFLGDSNGKDKTPPDEFGESIDEKIKSISEQTKSFEQERKEAMDVAKGNFTPQNNQQFTVDDIPF